MSQQGEKPTGHEDDWWRQLYDDSTEDTGPAAVADSLDDRFASASGTLGDGLDTAPETGPDAGARRTPPSAARSAPGRTPAPRAGSGRTPTPDARPASGRTPASPPAPRRTPTSGQPPVPPRTPTSDVPPAPRRTPPQDAPPRTPASPDAWSADDPRSAADAAAFPGRGTAPRPGARLDGPPRPERPPAVPDPSAPEAGRQPPPLPTQPPAGSARIQGTTEPTSPRQPGPAGGTSASAARPGGDPPEESPSGEPVSRPGRWERGPVPGPGTGVGPSGREAPASETASWEPTPWEPTPWEPPSWELPPPGPAPAAPSALPPGPKPPGFTAREPAPHDSRGARSDTPPAPPVDREPAAGTAPDVPPKPASAPLVPPDATGPEPAADALPSTTGGFRTPPTESAPEDLPTDEPREPVLSVVEPPPAAGHVGSGPPTYASEPTALPAVEPDELADLVADTVLDGARYGTSTLRAASVRGDSARYRGEPRRDALLTARFGTGEQALVLVAMATGARATPGAHRAAAEACRWIGQAVGRSHERLAADIRAARRGELKSGLHRLTDRSLGKLRASAAEQGVEPEEYTAGLRCLLLPADPECRTRVFFGVGAGGLFRLRDGEWQDIEPRVADTAGEAVVGFGSPPHETPEGDRLTMDLGITTPPSPYEPAPGPPRAPFRFRASVARPGDTLLLCTGGLAEPLRGEPELAEYLTTRWSVGDPPGLAAFLADASARVKGYADDRTAAAVWEA
ncbi:protein phosphatase 2C domain-containing protein [Streptomyces sp. NPDC059445]|uniref:protein phosphatase 2C domain-containing protein n=1 Tax=Streptomyces sp. NPDC059445 TaxID=3346832 RepID=UPI003674078F